MILFVKHSMKFAMINLIQADNSANTHIIVRNVITANIQDIEF